MIKTMRYKTIDKLRNVEQTKDSEEHEDNLSFTFFDDADGSTVDVGIGTEIDPSLRHSPIVDPDPSTLTDPAEPAQEDATPLSEDGQPIPVDQPSSVLQAPPNPEEQVLQDEIKPNFGLIIAAADDTSSSEPSNSTIDDFKAREARVKSLEALRSQVFSRNIKVNEVSPKEPTLIQGSLDIVGNEDAEAVPLNSDLEKLDAEYDKSKEKVAGLIIEGKAPLADQASTQTVTQTSTPVIIQVNTPTTTETSTKPQKPWLIRILYNGVSELLGSILKVILWFSITVIVSFGLILLAYFAWAQHTDSGLSTYEVTLKCLGDLKGIGVAVYEFLSFTIRGNEGE
jgi:hypothetical protein